MSVDEDDRTQAASGNRIGKAATVSRSTPIIVTVVVVLLLVLLAVLWRAGSNHNAAAVVPPGSVGTSYGSAGVETVELNGFNGTLAIGVGSTTQITATAQPVDGHAAPDLAFHLDPATHVLTLGCSGSGACPATGYSIVVPEHVGVSLRELSGQATLTGLSGPVSITASSADTTAVALRTESFTAAITSGTLNASFASAPARVSVSVTSAQATLRLPGTVGYDVRQQATSGDIRIEVPQSTDPAHTVQATAISGEIGLERE